LRETLHLKGRLNGVYLADTVLLADHLTLAGDTLILSRDFGPDDENTVIALNRHSREANRKRKHFWSKPCGCRKTMR
jgi:hypothetical protein